MGAPGEWLLGPVLSAILVTVALAGCALLKRRHRSAAHSPSHAIPAPPPGNVVEPEAQGAIISPFATRASRPSRTSHELNDVFNRNTLPAAHSSVSGIQSSLSGLPPTWVSGASNKQHSGNLNQASEADRASQLPGHGSSRFTRSPSQGTTRSASMQHAPPPDVLEALLAVNKDCVEGGSGLIAWPRNQSPQNADAAGGTEEAPNRGHTWIQGLTKDSFLLTHETQATNNGPGSSGGGYMLRTGTQHLQVSQLADPTWPHFIFGNPLQVTVGELLGRGGCGAVYAGTWRDKPVAVKVVQQVVNAAAAAAAATADAAIDAAPKDAVAAARAAFRRLPLSGFASPASAHGGVRGRGSSDTPRPTGDTTDPDSAALAQPLQLVPQPPSQPHRLSQPSVAQPGDYRNPDRNAGVRIAPGVTATASCGAGMASTAAVSDSMSLSTAETPPVGARRRPMLGDAAASVKKLRHPNVLRTYAYASMCMAPQTQAAGYGAPPPPPFVRHEHHVLLELCDGGSLRMWLDQHSRALEQLAGGGGVGGGGSGAIRNAAKAALEQDATVTLGTLGTVGTVGTAGGVGSVSLVPGTFLPHAVAGLPVPSPSPSPLVPQFSQRYSLTGALTTLTAIGGVDAWVEATVAAAEAVAAAVVSPAPVAEPVLEATPPGTPLTTIYSAASARKDMPSRRAGSTSGPPLPPLPPPASPPALSALPMFTPLKPQFTGNEKEQVLGPAGVGHGTLSTMPSLTGPSGLQTKLSSSAWHTAQGASGCAPSLPSGTAATTSGRASTEPAMPCRNLSGDVPGEHRLVSNLQPSDAPHDYVPLAHAPSCSSDTLTLRHQPSIDPALPGAPFGSAAANTTSSTTSAAPPAAGSDACSSPQPVAQTSSLNWDVNAPPDSVVRAWVGASELTRIAEDQPVGQAGVDTDTDPEHVRENEEGDMMGPTHAMYGAAGALVRGTSRAGTSKAGTSRTGTSQTGTRVGPLGQADSDATPQRAALMVGDEADGTDGQDPDDLTSVTVSALSEPSASMGSSPFREGTSLGLAGAGSGAALRARFLRSQVGFGGSVGVVADGVAAAGRRGPGCSSIPSWLGGRSGDMTCPPGMAMAIGMATGGSTSGMVGGAGVGSSALGREHVAAWALEVGSTGGHRRYGTRAKGLWTPGAASSSQGIGMETAEGLGWTTTLDSVSVPASVPASGTPGRSGTPVRTGEVAGGAGASPAAGSPLARVALHSVPCGAGGGPGAAGLELAGDGAGGGREPAAAGGRAGAQGLGRVVEEASCGGSVSVVARRDRDAPGSTGQRNGGGGAGGNSCGEGTSAAAGGSSHSTSATAGYSSYYYSNDPTVGSQRGFNGSLGASGRGTHKGGPRLWPSTGASAASGQHTAGGTLRGANADNSNNSFFARRSPGPGPAGFCFPFPNQDPDTASAPVASSKRSPPLPLVPEGVSQRLSAHQALLQDANTPPSKPETRQAAAWVGSGLVSHRTSGRRSAAGDATSSHTTVNTRPGSSSSNNSDIRLVPMPGLGPPYASRRHRAWVRQGTTRRHPLLNAAVSSSTATLDAFVLPANPSVTAGLQQHNLHPPHLAQNLHPHQLLHRNASLAGGTTTTNGTNVTGTHNSSAFQVVSQRCIVVDSGDDDDDVAGIYDLLEEDGEGEVATGGAGGAGDKVEGWEERRDGVPAGASASDEATLAGSSTVVGGGSSAAQAGADSAGHAQGSGQRASVGKHGQRTQESASLLPESQSSEQRSLSQRTVLSPETSTSQPMQSARLELLPVQPSPDLQPTLAAGASPLTATTSPHAHRPVSTGDAAVPLATRSPTPPSPAPATIPKGPTADPDILNQLNRRAVSMVRSILQAAANNGENNNGNATGGQAAGQTTSDAAAAGETGAGAHGARRLQMPARAMCAAQPDGEAMLESLGMRREELGYLCLALDCLVEAASGLAYLHDQGIVHGDIKASNLLLKVDPLQPKGFVLKLADFGFSRELDHGSHTYLSRPSGTLAYLAPELLTQYRQSAAADLYAFGLLVYEVATTHQLFKGLQVAQVLFAKAHNADWQHLKWPSWCPTDVREVARGCSLFHPADRLTAADALDRLRQLRTRYCCLLLATRQGQEQEPDGQREQGAVVVEEQQG